MSALVKSRAAYRPLPDWIGVLARAIDEEGAVKPVAERVGYSPSAVSSVINGSYTGRLAHIETAVRGALMRDFVSCPVLGTISGEACSRHQRVKSPPTTNPTRARLFKACRSGTCPHSSITPNGDTP